MTPAPPLQKEYIITDMQIRRAMAFMNRDCEMDADEWIEMDKSFRSRPHTTTPSERDKVLDELKEWVRLYRIEIAQHVTHSNSYHCNRFHKKLLELRQAGNP